MRKTLIVTLCLPCFLISAAVAYSSYISHRGASMGVMVIVAYRPRPGREQRLLELTREHVQVLRRLGLATDRPACAMRAKDGTIVEVFEWKSKEALASAHANPEIQQMWKRYEEVCEYVPLATLKESSDLFAGFDPIEF
jgi:quinol monooxygenase YgiN